MSSDEKGQDSRPDHSSFPHNEKRLNPPFLPNSVKRITDNSISFVDPNYGLSATPRPLRFPFRFIDHQIRQRHYIYPPFLNACQPQMRLTSLFRLKRLDLSRMFSVTFLAIFQLPASRLSNVINFSMYSPLPS